MQFLSGFESTHIFGTGKDVLDTTRHTEFFERDLRLARESNLKLLRYSAPWHKIEAVPGVYDWTWMDAAMNCVRNLGIAPILDPLHHTSFPVWLADGFGDPRFVDSYVRFVTALANRYPWARHYTVINEPFVTVFFCGHEAIWQPYKRGGENFVAMILNAARATVLISRMLVETVEDVQLIHVDAAEQHRATASEAEDYVRFKNYLRFLVQDLILGKINENHALFGYLRENGASENDLNWFVEYPARIDVIGLDYYAHCELEWSAPDVRIYPNRNPIGFAELAIDYVEHFRLPVMLSETNIRGTIYDRISWLKFMFEQCERLEIKLKEYDVPFLGFCWYPFVDSTDWDTLVREANNRVDPQGIFLLDDEREKRIASELSDIFTKLASGEIASKNVPAYRFQPPLDKTFAGFMPLMRHWNWQEPPSK